MPLITELTKKVIVDTPLAADFEGAADTLYVYLATGLIWFPVTQPADREVLARLMQVDVGNATDAQNWYDQERVFVSEYSGYDRRGLPNNQAGTYRVLIPSQPPTSGGYIFSSFGGTQYDSLTGNNYGFVMESSTVTAAGGGIELPDEYESGDLLFAKTVTTPTDANAINSTMYIVAPPIPADLNWIVNQQREPNLITDTATKRIAIETGTTSADVGYSGSIDFDTTDDLFEMSFKREFTGAWGGISGSLIAIAAERAKEIIADNAFDRPYSATMIRVWLPKTTTDNVTIVTTTGATYTETVNNGNWQAFDGTHELSVRARNDNGDMAIDIFEDGSLMRTYELDTGTMDYIYSGSITFYSHSDRLYSLDDLTDVSIIADPEAVSKTAEVYFSNTAGDEVRGLVSHTHVDDRIEALMALDSDIFSVADITARDALSLTTDSMVLVTDASDDATVTSGAAMYFYDQTADTWTKTYEFEGMDLSFTWAALTTPATTRIDGGASGSYRIPVSQSAALSGDFVVGCDVIDNGGHCRIFISDALRTNFSNLDSFALIPGVGGGYNPYGDSHNVVAMTVGTTLELKREGIALFVIYDGNIVYTDPAFGSHDVYLHATALNSSTDEERTLDNIHRDNAVVTSWDAGTYVYTPGAGGPLSSVAAIDGMVTDSHTHANTAVLDGINEDGTTNNMTYNSKELSGNPVIIAAW